MEAARAYHTKHVSKEMAQLEAREKTLAAAEKAGSDALASFEWKSRGVLRSLYGEGYDEPLVTPDGGLLGLLTKLVEELENIAAAVGSLVEVECRTLFTAAATRVFSHLHLQDPSFDLGALIEPVAPKARDAAAEAVKGQVKILLEKFRYVDPETAAARASGEDDDGVVDDGLQKVGDGSNQG